MKSRPLAIKLALSWLWVAIPLGWGVYQSAVKSAPLFGIQSVQPETPDPPTPEAAAEDPE